MPDGSDSMSALFHGRGPGRILILLGGALIAFGFVGWMMLLFHGDDSRPLFGSNLPSGLPLGAVYFGAMLAGAVTAGIGTTMANAATTGLNFSHWIMSVLVVAAVGFATIRVLDGAPLSAINPFTATHTAPGDANAKPANGTQGQGATKRNDHPVTITQEPDYGMVFEPSSLDVSDGETVTFHNTTKSACSFKPIQGELPTNAGQNPTVPAGGTLTLTWHGSGLWSFTCRGQFSEHMVVTSL